MNNKITLFDLQWLLVFIRGLMSYNFLVYIFLEQSSYISCQRSCYISGFCYIYILLIFQKAAHDRLGDRFHVSHCVKGTNDGILTFVASFFGVTWSQKSLMLISPKLRKFREKISKNIWVGCYSRCFKLAGRIFWVGNHDNLPWIEGGMSFFPDQCCLVLGQKYKYL